MKSLKLLSLVVLIAISCAAPQKEEAQEDKVINVYSHRHYDADKMIWAAFEEETGIKVNVVRAGADELINRMELEAENSPADVLITVDAARLNRAKNKGLLQKADYSGIPVPAALKDPDGFWTAITFRARVIAYKKETVDPSEITSYMDLADPKWQGKVLIRSSSSGYNQSLLASILYNYGEENAQTWANGVVSNMARDPKGGDRDQIKAIASGVGELAVTNTYYVGLLLNSDNEEEVAAGETVGLIFPEQDSYGTHRNISGIGITKYSPNRENAMKFIEFLTSEKTQKQYAEASYEYPANSNVSPAATVAAWGDWSFDGFAFADSMYFTNKAVELFDQAGWQ